MKATYVVVRDLLQRAVDVERAGGSRLEAALAWPLYVLGAADVICVLEAKEPGSEPGAGGDGEVLRRVAVAQASRAAGMTTGVRALMSKHPCSMLEAIEQMLRSPCSHAKECIDRVVGNQQQNGAIWAMDPGRHPEAQWADALIALHAIDMYARWFADEGAARASARAADWVQRELQPDHATSQPWGLPAFLRSEQTQPMVEQMLHAARLHLTRNRDVTTLILLADALWAMEH